MTSVMHLVGMYTHENINELLEIIGHVRICMQIPGAAEDIGHSHTHVRMCMGVPYVYMYLAWSVLLDVLTCNITASQFSNFVITQKSPKRLGGKQPPNAPLSGMWSVTEAGH